MCGPIMLKKSIPEQSILSIRSRAVYRQLLLRGGGPLVHCLVNEFPKSGGSWLGKMIAQSSGVDFPQNRAPSKMNSVFHGHYMCRFKRVRNVVLWRDPRDIMVSWYYHCFFYNERNNHKRVDENRSAVKFEGYDDINRNMLAFIDWCFNKGGAPGFSWNDFFDFWYKEDPYCFHTSYEKLTADPVLELGRICSFNGVPQKEQDLIEVVKKFSFKKESARSAGESDSSSFLRKGIVGDWVNVFDDKTSLEFEKITGARLKSLDKILLTSPD